MRIQIPTTCPCCDYPLVSVNDQLFCRNTACSAQLNKKVENFCKVLSIKGMGPRTIEKLNISDLTEIFYLDVEELAETLGSGKLADKLLLEINKAKEADLATVLAAFSIPLIGETAAKKISSVVEHISEITEEKCKEAGLGEKATSNLIGWISTDYEEMKEFLPFSFKSTKTNNVNGENAELVCITGKLESFKTKAEAAEALLQAGFAVSDNVTKKTKYLVDESGKGSSKRQKAEELGITIISNLLNFLKKE